MVDVLMSDEKRVDLVTDLFEFRDSQETARMLADEGIDEEPRFGGLQEESALSEPDEAKALQADPFASRRQGPFGLWRASP